MDPKKRARGLVGKISDKATDGTKRITFTAEAKAKIALEAMKGVKTFSIFEFYDNRCRHSSLDDRTPAEIYGSRKEEEIAA